MEQLVGAEKARQVMESKNYYRWIYRTILTERAKIHDVLVRYNLESLPAVSLRVLQGKGN